MLKARCCVFCFAFMLLPCLLVAQKRAWVYTKSFHSGTFTFVTSDRKVYEAHCHRVEFIKGTSKAGDHVCQDTLASVAGCTPDHGYPDSDTISLDAERGDMTYHSLLSKERMKLKDVRAATEKEFAQAQAVCSKMPWEQ